MYKFKGTINGVEYTNRNEFFDALKEAKSDGNIKVTLSEEQSEEQLNKENQDSSKKIDDRKILEEENQDSSKKIDDKKIFEEKIPADTKENEPSNMNQYKYESLFDILGDLFISFLKTQNNELYKKLIDNTKPENKNNIENVKDYNEFVAKYFFKETTYVFKGDTEDEFHLDRFAGLLKDRSQEIEDEIPLLSKSQKNVLYNKALSEISRITKQIKNTEDERISTDRELAGIEKIISSYKEIGYIIPKEIEDSYNKQKNSFDILTNRISYYQMLADYYRTIGPKLDPEQ